MGCDEGGGGNEILFVIIAAINRESLRYKQRRIRKEMRIIEK
jgi:hypothetical protein